MSHLYGATPVEDLVVDMLRIRPIRWAVNVAKWQPTCKEWIQGLSAIQTEEKERIQRFVYRNDAKSALLGRLLMRKCIAQVFNLPTHRIVLDRGPKGKPIIKVCELYGLFKTL